jgi:hypothetical protein
MMPELAELFTQLVALGASSLGLSTAEFVRDALLESAPLEPTEPSLRVLLSELISEPIHVPISRVDRVGSNPDQSRSISSASRVHLGSNPDPSRSISINLEWSSNPDQFALSLLPDLESEAPRVHLDPKGQCEAVLAAVLSLMRKLTLARSTPRAASYTSHRLLLILRLDVDGETGSPIWTWRLAQRISTAITSEGLPVILCIVTTPTSALPGGGADTEDEQLQAEGDDGVGDVPIRRHRSAQLRTKRGILRAPNHRQGRGHEQRAKHDQQGRARGRRRRWTTEWGGGGSPTAGGKPVKIMLNLLNTIFVLLSNRNEV